MIDGLAPEKDLALIGFEHPDDVLEYEMIEILKQLGKALISALLTEKFIKEIVIFLLEKLAKKTTNDIDDVIVQKMKEALKV